MEASANQIAGADERVLVLAPKGRDAELICRLLEEAGIFCISCQRTADLLEEVRNGAGVLLLAAETLTPGGLGQLEEWLENEPSWSALPVVLLGGDHGRSKTVMETLGGNLTVLERPTHPLTLLSLVRSALASRRRQYRTRDLLRKLAKTNEALRREAGERMQAEERNRRLADIVTSSSDAIIATTVDGTVTDWNRAAERTFGYTAAEILGRPITTIYPPERMGDKEGIFAPVLRGVPVKNYETVRLAKDGRRLQVSISISPVRDASGVIVGTSGIIQDISQIKKAERELERYMARLEQSNRDLQDFASIASHDLKEPLRKVKAFGDALQARFGASLGADGRDYIARMQAASERMQRLLDGLLEYSRVTTRARPQVPLDLNDIVREVLHDLEIQILETEGDVAMESLPAVEADPSQMRQLFQNLIGNALKFHGRERPMVHIRGFPCTDGLLRIEVRDNGIGFDEKHAERIFIPFQRLHGKNSPYPGTGMGLAICKKIMERHGGSIAVKSSSGKGSTFILLLPCHHDHHAVSPYTTPDP